MYTLTHTHTHTHTLSFSLSHNPQTHTLSPPPPPPTTTHTLHYITQQLTRYQMFCLHSPEHHSSFYVIHMLTFPWSMEHFRHFKYNAPLNENSKMCYEKLSTHVEYESAWQLWMALHKRDQPQQQQDRDMRTCWLEGCIRPTRSHAMAMTVADTNTLTLDRLALISRTAFSTS